MPHRFNGPYRQSHLADYTVCPRKFYFTHIRELEPEGVRASQIIGQAAHATIQTIHEQHLVEEADIRRAFFMSFSREKESVAHLNGQLRWDNDPQEVMDEAGTYLTAYAAKPFNQEARILHAEYQWFCQVGRYPFTGRIDQVREHEGKMILVDFKTSSYRPTEEFLRRSYQLSLYAYALWKGYGTPPAEIWHYQLKDHLPYKRSGSWGKTGTERGSGVYITHRSEADLEYLEKDVSRICAAMRFGLYFRRPANLGSCHGFCQHTDVCLGEMESPLLPASTISTIEEVINHEQVA